MSRTLTMMMMSTMTTTHPSGMQMSWLVELSPPANGMSWSVCELQLWLHPQPPGGSLVVDDRQLPLGMRDLELPF